VSASHNVRDLSPDARQIVEQLLGRPLNGDEQISIVAYKPVSAEDKKAALQEMRELWDRAAEKTNDISEEEWDDIVNEAMRSVRPNYRPIR
jgi:hypothetical protein